MAAITTEAETNLIKAADLKKVREVDFVTQFVHGNLNKLNEVLGTLRRIPMTEGTTMYVYSMKGSLEDGNVPEGEVIPLSHFEQEKKAVGEMSLLKYRKAASAESIQRHGREVAIVETDQKAIREVQKDIRKNLFTFLNGDYSGATINGTSATTVEGKTLQEALAKAWGQLQTLFEDDTAEAVYFINPQDVADYLATANITTQTVFGMNYVQDFLGLGTVIMSSQITKGTFVATAKENIIMYYMDTSGDLAASFGLTTDELGLIGINSEYRRNERGQIESLIMTGVQYLVEYAEGVVKGTISSGE